MFPSLMMTAGGFGPLEMRSYNSSTTGPADIKPGDLLIIGQTAGSGGSTFTTPSGWTRIFNGQSGFGTGGHWVMKIADGSEAGVSFNIIGGSSKTSAFVCVKGPFTGWTLPYSNKQVTTGNPAARTLSAADMGTECINFAVYSGTDSVNWTWTENWVARAHDNYVKQNEGVIAWSVSPASRPKYDITIDQPDEGSNVMFTGIIVPTR